MVKKGIYDLLEIISPELRIMEDLFNLFTILIALLAPTVSLILLYVFYDEFRPLALSVHMGENITIGFILGSVFALGSLPLVITAKAWLSADMAGAVIPALLSVYLWHKNRLGFLSVGLGIAIIAFISYSVTTVNPDLGIVSAFPDFLLPIGAGVVYACICGFVKKKEAMLPISFIITCLGILIGADLVRLPVLAFSMESSGVVGGARIFDMVAMGPLLAFFLTFLILLSSKGFSRKRLLGPSYYRKYRIPMNERDIRSRYAEAYDELRAKRTERAVVLAAEAVRGKMELLTSMFGSEGSEKKENLTKEIFADPYARKDHDSLMQMAERKNLGEKEGYSSVLTARLLLEELELRKRRVLAGIGRRTAAFLLDQAIIILFTFSLYGILLLAGLQCRSIIGGGAESFPPWLCMAFIIFSLWAFLHFPYFLFFELYRGQTPGKMALRIRVKALGTGRLSFERAFGRTITRYLDVFGGFFPLALLFLIFTSNRQRIGDLLSRTVVLNSEDLEEYRR